jgi:hypothetical protein
VWLFDTTVLELEAKTELEPFCKVEEEGEDEAEEFVAVVIPNNLLFLSEAFFSALFCRCDLCAT